MHPVQRTMNGKPAIRFRVDLLKYPLDPNSKGSQVQSPMFETRHDTEATIFATLSLSFRIPYGDIITLIPKVTRNASKAKDATMTQHPAVRNCIDVPPKMNPTKRQKGILALNAET